VPKEQLKNALKSIDRIKEGVTNEKEIEEVAMQTKAKVFS